MDLISKEESYAERRQLFKNIWDTAMQINEKDGDIMAKPKVIKTLRLDEVDRCAISKRKKERIKNLRTVCKKILDFCDRQDEDDVFYEQTTLEGKELQPNITQHALELKSKKLKTNRESTKVIKAKSLFVGRKNLGDQATTSESRDDYCKKITNTEYNGSPIKMKRTTVVRRTETRYKTSHDKSNPDTQEINVQGKGMSPTRRKVVRKRHRSKKLPVKYAFPQKPSGIIDGPYP